MYDPGCYGPDDNSEEALPREQENGWTTMDPSSDSRIIYVSSSDGDDSADGLTPETAIATLDRGIEMLRDGYPDWMLLRRGDSWEGTLALSDISGRSPDERMVIASYGDSLERPMIRTGSNGGIELCCGPSANLAFLDIAFYAHTRDPDSPDYQGPGRCRRHQTLLRRWWGHSLRGTPFTFSL